MTPEPPVAAAPPALASRLPAIDWMRGLVMVLMTVDHASDVFNHDLVQVDSAVWGANGADLTPFGGPWQFLTRWITHLCAPTFVFLAGASLAITVERRTRRGEPARAIDRHLVARGLLIVAFEAWIAIGFQVPVLQVLYAIGASMVCMAFLRRLDTRVILTVALAWIVLGEWVTDRVGLRLLNGPAPIWGSLSFVNSAYPGSLLPDFGPFHWAPWKAVMYPLLPWLAMMMLGWAFGRWLVEAREKGDLERRAARLLLACGLAGLAVFFLQRALDGYGNFWLYRSGDPSLLRWLQVSKYPPSLAFCALELGLMALLLAGFFRWQGREGAVAARAPLLVFGQTALFFYLIHVHLMNLGCHLLFGGGMGNGPFGVAGAWLGALGALVVMYPLCLWFRKRKAQRPASFLRFF